MSSFQSSSSSAQSPASSDVSEFTVRIPRDGRKRITMMKFGSGAQLDFSKLGEQSVKMERENNLKAYKSANDLDLLPKYGAGSEYGRDLKEESRRKKYGIMLKRYVPEDQPWLLKIGSGKQTKKYKGVREGSISENTSYYIFTKASDGAFEAFPIEEWYNFSPIVRYKYLNSDEAEEEYLKRDKTLNLFSIMLKKRYKKDDDNVDDDEDEDGKKKKGKKSGKKKGLQLTDMEDWDDLDMSDDDDSGEDNGSDDEGKSKKKKKKKPLSKKKSRNAKQNSDDEAIEESDEGDNDDKEVDYMSDSGSDSDLSGTEKDDTKKGNKYDDKGVDQEAGLKNILDSDAEDEDEEEKNKEEEDEDIDKEEAKNNKKEKGLDDSSSSSSEDDSDIEKDASKLASFLEDKKIKKEKKVAEQPSSSSQAESASKIFQSVSADAMKDKNLKRKAEKSVDNKTPSGKKHRMDESESALEEDLRRYLMRKPMTTKELVLKFKAKKLNMQNDKLQQIIVQLLKKINPEKTTVGIGKAKTLYLSLKKPE